MDTTVIRLAAAGVLAAHGIGHVLGWVPAWGIARFEGMSSHSWLVSPVVGFVIAAGGLLSGQAWWRQVAIVSASVSLAAVALYPQAFPATSAIGSVVVNAVVLYAIISAGWGAETSAV